MRALFSGIAVSLLTHAGIAAQVPAGEEGLSVVAKVAALQPAWEARVVEAAPEVAPAGPLHAPSKARPAASPPTPTEEVADGSRPGTGAPTAPPAPPERGPATAAKAPSPRPAARPKVERERPAAATTPTPVIPAQGAAEDNASAGLTTETPADGRSNGTERVPAAEGTGSPDGPAALGSSTAPGDGSGGGRPAATAGGGDEAHAAGLARVAEARAKVEKGLRYPKAARRLGLEGEVLVRCRPEAGGWDVTIASSSGVDHFDREAVRATVEALAALSPEGRPFVLPVRFRLMDNGDVAGRRGS